ncbi:RNA-binding protein Nova-2 [Hondaea fermentalgiana]|uniref:RNA-binding protein Nova-2 n=1 Tax=Hondaea fermentalgiana TaxID=2315210 RepID=A0A2R5GC23_9STRA|nr:RNA-binding protein Nova-2 [Hondaea fermentalgiana]|eukprot:GBG26133.1 RNA-binding protein Nova-2 [Hondaea fermentalgiana]
MHALPFQDDLGAQGKPKIEVARIDRVSMASSGLPTVLGTVTLANLVEQDVHDWLNGDRATTPMLQPHPPLQTEADAADKRAVQGGMSALDADDSDGSRGISSMTQLEETLESLKFARPRKSVFLEILQSPRRLDDLSERANEYVVSQIEIIKSVQQAGMYPEPVAVFKEDTDRDEAKLDLSHRGLGDDKLVAATKVAVRGRNLAMLDLSENRLSDNGGASIFGSIASETDPEAVKIAKPLTLVLARNALSARSCDALASLLRSSSHRICELNLSRNKLNSRCMAALSAALAEDSTLKRLDVSYNPLGPAGVSQLASALVRNETLRVLSVAWTQAGAIGALAMLRAIHRNDKLDLESLDLSRNAIGRALSSDLLNLPAATPGDVVGTLCKLLETVSQGNGAHSSTATLKSSSSNAMLRCPMTEFKIADSCKPTDSSDDDLLDPTLTNKVDHIAAAAMRLGENLFDMAEFVVNRVCPPGEVAFFFTVDGVPTVSDLEQQTPWPLVDAHDRVNPPRRSDEKDFIVNVATIEARQTLARIDLGNRRDPLDVDASFRVAHSPSTWALEAEIQSMPEDGPSGSRSSNGRGSGGGGAVWGLSLPGTFVQSDDFGEALDFIMRCKDNDGAAAESFLRGTLRLLRQRLNLDDEDAEDEENGNREFDAFIGDDSDDKQTTLVLLVPGQSHIIGHLIGKSGSEITKLEAEANVSIRVESKSKMPLGSSERRIFIVGSVANSVYTQQRITQRIHEKLREEGVKQELIKIVIPHESVPHLIGKGGSSIKRLQELSHARIQVEQETSVVPGTIGRSVTIQGTQYERSLAQYLVSRQMTENRSTPKDWQGGLPQVQPQHQLGGPFPLRGSGNLILEDLVPGVPPIPGLNPPSAPGSQSIGSGANGYYTGSQGVGLGGSGGDSDSVSSQGYVDPDLGWNSSKIEEVASQAGMGTSGMRSSLGAATHMEGGTGGEAYHSTAQQYERLVPNGAVAHLIGRNGSVISDIQKKSGTRISFSKNPGPRAAEVGMGMGHYQKVTIIGTPYAIQLAQSIISKKIIEHVGEDFERL